MERLMANVKTALDSEQIEGIVNQIVQCFHPSKVILFGSYASGTPTADSDLDLLIVMPNPPGRDQTYQVKSELQTRLPLPLQIIFMREETFEETRDVVGGLAYPASHSGKILYEKSPRAGRPGLRP